MPKTRFADERGHVDPIVTRFSNSIEWLGPKLKALYFFGSRARGAERPDSDYDLEKLANEVFEAAKKFPALAQELLTALQSIRQ